MPCRKGMTESDRGAKMASMSPARVRAPAIMTCFSIRTCDTTLDAWHYIFDQTRVGM